MTPWSLMPHSWLYVWSLGLSTVRKSRLVGGASIGGAAIAASTPPGEVRSITSAASAADAGAEGRPGVPEEHAVMVAATATAAAAAMTPTVGFFMLIPISSPAPEHGLFRATPSFRVLPSRVVGSAVARRALLRTALACSGGDGVEPSSPSALTDVRYPLGKASEQEVVR